MNHFDYLFIDFDPVGVCFKSLNLKRLCVYAFAWNDNSVSALESDPLFIVFSPLILFSHLEMLL